MSNTLTDFQVCRAFGAQIVLNISGLSLPVVFSPLQSSYDHHIVSISCPSPNNLGQKMQIQYTNTNTNTDTEYIYNPVRKLKKEFFKKGSFSKKN